MAIKSDNINDLPPDERVKVRYPEYAGLIDILVYEFGFIRDDLLPVLEYDERWFNDTCIAFTLPELLRLINRAKVELK